MTNKDILEFVDAAGDLLEHVELLLTHKKGIPPEMVASASRLRAAFYSIKPLTDYVEADKIKLN